MNSRLDKIDFRLDKIDNIETVVHVNTMCLKLNDLDINPYPSNTESD